MAELPPDVDVQVYRLRQGRFLATITRDTSTALSPSRRCWKTTVSSDDQFRVPDLKPPPVPAGGGYNLIYTESPRTPPVLPLHLIAVVADEPPFAQAREVMAKLEVLADQWERLMIDFQLTQKVKITDVTST